jgi:hypothetical protein
MRPPIAAGKIDLQILCSIAPTNLFASFTRSAASPFLSASVR